MNESIQRIALEAKKLSYAKLIDAGYPAMAEKMDVRGESYYLADAIVTFTFKLFTKKVYEQSVEFEARWPRTWWQHFKEAHFPRWALERWPVEYRVQRDCHTFEVHAHLKDVVFPQDEEVVYFHLLDGIPRFFEDRESAPDDHMW